MTNNDGITDDEQYAAACRYQNGFLGRVDPITAFMAGAEWARARLTAQELTDAEVEAARAAYWPAYSEAVRNAPSNKPGQGISAEDGRKAGLAGHRAALSAARAARRDEEKQ